MTWRFHAYHLTTGVALGELNVTSWSSVEELNDAGSWTMTLAPPRNAAEARAAIGATIEGRTVVVAARGGNPVFTGYIGPGQRRPDLAGGGLLSYLDRRTLTVRKSYAAVDQHTIAQELVDHTNTNGAMIDVGQVEDSGVLRDQTWETWERKNIGEALRQKAALIDGYDFDVRTELDAGVLVRRLRCWYPRRGRSVAQGGPVFHVGANVTTVPAIAGPEDLVTYVTALGDEIDTTTQERLLRTATRTDLLAAGWPLLEAVLNLRDVSVAATLQAHADGHGRQYGTDDVDELVLDIDPSHPTWGWGSWGLGDDCQVIVPAGLDVWFPDGLSSTRRVIRHLWNWSADAGESLQVVTGPRWTS